MQCCYPTAKRRLDRSPSPAWLLYHWYNGTRSLSYPDCCTIDTTGHVSCPILTAVPLVQWGMFLVLSWLQYHWYNGTCSLSYPDCCTIGTVGHVPCPILTAVPLIQWDMFLVLSWLLYHWYNGTRSLSYPDCCTIDTTGHVPCPILTAVPSKTVYDNYSASPNINNEINIIIKMSTDSVNKSK